MFRSYGIRESNGLTISAIAAVSKMSVGHTCLPTFAESEALYKVEIPGRAMSPVTCYKTDIHTFTVLHGLLASILRGSPGNLHCSSTPSTWVSSWLWRILVPKCHRKFAYNTIGKWQASATQPEHQLKPVGSLGSSPWSSLHVDVWAGSFCVCCLRVLALVLAAVAS